MAAHGWGRQVGQEGEAEGRTRSSNGQYRQGCSHGAGALTALRALPPKQPHRPVGTLQPPPHPFVTTTSSVSSPLPAKLPHQAF